MATTTETTTAHTVGIGSVFVNSWGYDQTNIDYYEVVDMSKSGKTATLQRICTAIVSSDGYGSDRVAPARGVPYTREMGEWIRNDDGTHRYESHGRAAVPTIKKRVQVSTYDGRPFVAMDHGWCGLWTDGTTDRQTSSGWGH